MSAIPIQFPYGSVYFRKSNPPREDWERDYKQAAEDGVNIFRHWFMWGSIETAPGVFDWEDYDRQLDLAEKYGIKTIIAEISHSIPQWAAAKYPELLTIDRNGAKRYPRMGVSTASGGFNSGLCLDKAAGRELNANFLTKLAEHYRSHPALLGYDVQNECNYGSGVCYCDDTIAAFQSWLTQKYGTIKNLMEAWKVYSYTSFEEIRYPEEMGFYAESKDWLEFCHDNFYKTVQWKIDTIQKADSKNLMTAHGTASTFRSRETAGSDDWESAKPVEVYGFTWVPCRHGNEPWRLMSAGDLTRAGSRGKTFWHAEAQGGHLWLQPQLKGRAANDARVADEKDVRIWNLMSFSCGTRGLLYPRYRPLLDGPLFGAFAPYDMDGSPTPRSEMASKIAKWLNAPETKKLVDSSCVKGQIGILYAPECSEASYLHSLAGNEDVFARMMYGAYQGFFDNNIQADFVHFDHINEYKALYFPYPIALSSSHAETLKDWVKAGGVLISESCPAYFGDDFHVGTTQPNYGLDEVFGVQQKHVEFMPDIFKDIEIEIFGNKAKVEGFLQTYTLKGGKACAYYKDDPVAVINNYGKGKTLLLGAFLSGQYGRSHDAESAAVFRQILTFAGQEPIVSLEDNAIHARISSGESEEYLWLLNTSNENKTLSVKLPPNRKAGEVLWQGGVIIENNGASIVVNIDARDGLILVLQK
jgi:beta-galactosidase